MSDDIDLKHSDSGAPDRGTRDTDADRDSCGGELSGGRQDRSRELLREELTRNLDDAARRSGRPRDWEPEGRPAREGKSATDKAKDGEQQTPGIGHNFGDATPLAAGGPPARLTKDAKAKWSGLEKSWKDEILKIDADSQNGHDLDKKEINELKAKYNDIDQALAPHLGVIRAHGHTSGAAISQMFNWFNYLHEKPLEAFPALVRSMGADKLFVQHYGQQQQAAGQQQQTNGQQGYDPRQIINYVDQRLGELNAAQQEQTIQGVLADFAKTHEHFERVRGKMSTLIQGGTIPLTPEGKVDLESAYRASLMLEPDFLEQTVAERIAAEKKKQRDYADRARRSSASLAPFAPGSNNSVGPKNKRKGVSVRDSINAAMDEVADR